MLVDDNDRKKFAPNVDPLEQEDRLPFMQGWGAMASDFAILTLNQDVAALQASANPTEWEKAQLNAYAKEVVKGKKRHLEARFHNEFANRFREWIRGNGSSEEYQAAGMLSYVGDHSKRNKNKPISDHESVIGYLEQWQNRVIEYDKKKATMKLRMGRGGAPGEAASIDDLWKYYKFVVYGLPAEELKDDDDTLELFTRPLDRTVSLDGVPGSRREQEEAPPPPPPRRYASMPTEPPRRMDIDEQSSAVTVPDERLRQMELDARPAQQPRTDAPMPDREDEIEDYPEPLMLDTKEEEMLLAEANNANEEAARLQIEHDKEEADKKEREQKEREAREREQREHEAKQREEREQTQKRIQELYQMHEAQQKAAAEAEARRKQQEEEMKRLQEQAVIEKQKLDAEKQRHTEDLRRQQEELAQQKAKLEQEAAQEKQRLELEAEERRLQLLQEAEQQRQQVAQEAERVRTQLAQQAEQARIQQEQQLAAQAAQIQQQINAQAQQVQAAQHAVQAQVQQLQQATMPTVEHSYEAPPPPPPPQSNKRPNGDEETLQEPPKKPAAPAPTAVKGGQIVRVTSPPPMVLKGRPPPAPAPKGGNPPPSSYNAVILRPASDDMEYEYAHPSARPAVDELVNQQLAYYFSAAKPTRPQMNRVTADAHAAAVEAATQPQAQVQRTEEDLQPIQRDRLADDSWRGANVAEMADWAKHMDKLFMVMKHTTAARDRAKAKGDEREVVVNEAALAAMRARMTRLNQRRPAASGPGMSFKEYRQTKEWQDRFG